MGGSMATFVKQLRNSGMTAEAVTAKTGVLIEKAHCRVSGWISGTSPLNATS